MSSTLKLFADDAASLGIGGGSAANLGSSAFCVVLC
jgi:hypothetical protein